MATVTMEYRSTQENVENVAGGYPFVYNKEAYMVMQIPKVMSDALVAANLYDPATDVPCMKLSDGTLTKIPIGTKIDFPQSHDLVLNM